MTLTNQQKTTLAAIAQAICGPLPPDVAATIVSHHVHELTQHNPTTANDSTSLASAMTRLTQVNPTDLGVVESMAVFLAALPADKWGEFQTVLGLLATGWGTKLVTGSARAVPFDQLTTAEAEAALQALMLSRFAVVRSLYRAFKTIVSICVFGKHDTKAGALSPVYAALGYAGEPQEKARPPRASYWQPTFEKYVPKRVQAMAEAAAPGQPIELDTDVVVIGSGAGGGVVAAQLAQAGHRVLVLEKANYSHPADADYKELEGIWRLFEASGMVASEDGSMSIFAGSAFGGGTYVNWSASLRPPPHVYNEWANEYKLPYFGTHAYQEAIDAVCQRSGVSAAYLKHNGPNQIFVNGCKQLGLPIEDVPQNTAGHQHSCGLCTLGCPYGEKQGSHVTWLRDAANAGAKFVDGCHVERVTYDEAKHATGVIGTLLNGKVQLVVKAKTVVSSCGSINTPALLLRSGLKNRNIGRNLRLHPVTTVNAYFPKQEHEIKSWTGSIMTAMSPVVQNIHGNGYGAILEVPTSALSVGVGTLPWRSNQDFHRLLMQYPRMSSTIALARDCDSVGQVKVDAQGRARIHYQLGPKDATSLTEGMIHLAKILLSQGAVEVNTTQHAMPPLQLHSPDDLANPIDCETTQQWLAKLKSLGTEQNSLSLFSAHQMGSCRMGATPAMGAVNPDGESWEVQGLYVADASLFPTASGVNPMVTTFSIAYSVAQFLKANLDEEHRTGRKPNRYPVSWLQHVHARFA
ncbi:Aste57867_20772 [Aphanomyces stellatus]|uniref:Long-chain-alcohol oxidase n=1 Tax=Aphanomyces stellatus TaxID=120398 RepID=A0A485LGG8_9STRA|nr:hypothetical protein As57867_020704 [Aphanomyces stellatus]VFT97451.1 Aste57867_20772 [Aphanomyces stellatus]